MLSDYCFEKLRVTVQPEVTLPKISEVTPQQPDEETEGASITEDDDVS